MKINVKDLEPNPFRRIERYPIDREKVESLKISIKETSFWDNILVRPNGEKFQIAYGHHRFQALKELKIKEVDLPVRNISDVDMIRIMANENLEWSTSPVVMNETILVAKEFLDSELAKYATWEEGASNKFIRSLIKDEQAWHKTKATGAGQTTILKFLGSNWKQWMVQAALRMLYDNKIDRKAAEQFKDVSPANVFVSAVKERNVPKKQQRRIAKELIKEGVGRGGIKEAVNKKADDLNLPPSPIKPKPFKPKELPDFPTFVSSLVKDMASVRIGLEKVKPYLGNLRDGIIKTELINEGKVLLDLLTEIVSQ